MRRDKLQRLLCLSGVLGLLFYILHDFIGGLYYPGYDRLSQAVSDLTAVDAPSYLIASGFSAVYGLFSCLCGAMVSVVVYEDGVGSRMFRLGIYLFAVMNWVSGIGYSLFPLSTAGFAGTIRDILHAYVVTGLVVLLSIVSLLFIIIGGIKNRGALKFLSAFAAAMLLCMFGGAVGVNLVPPAYFGIAERFSTYSAVIFNALLGLYGCCFFCKTF